MLGKGYWDSDQSTSASRMEEGVAIECDQISTRYHQQEQQALDPVPQTAVQQSEHRGGGDLLPFQQKQQQLGLSCEAQEEHFLCRQDEQLNVLETTVGNLKSIGLQIGEEIDGHQRLLGELDEHVERSQGALNRNLLMLRKVVDRQSTTCLCFTVVVLSVTLLVLIILAY